MDVFFQPGPVRVKICGVTTAADAAMVVDSGAEAIGINLFPGSKRAVALADVRDWVRELPLSRIAVVVNASADDLARLGDAGCFDAIQFHGDESPEFCAGSPLPWIRAVRVLGPPALNSALDYQTSTLLLDGHAASGYGGTGATVDPQLAAEFIRVHPERRVILAGGLRPETVAEAVRMVRPHGVDVASGVESPGNARRKDAARIRAFVDAARAS